MTRAPDEDEARARAVHLDRRLSDSVEQFDLPSPRKLFSELRIYLERRTNEQRTRNNVNALIKRTDGRAEVAIEVGPSIDKGPTERHFRFDSGARLSFGVWAREEGKGSKLLGYRFLLVLPTGSVVPAVRFDLIPAPHNDPLHEPRCHVHLGLGDFRIPTPALSPIEVLDRLFFVVEPAFRSR